MTDLEDLWDDLPVGRPPTQDILRAGRRAEAAASPAARRRRFLLRPLLTAGIATGVVGAFLAGTLVDGADDPGGAGGPGGPGGTAGSGPGRPADPTHVAFQADLDPAESCDDLLAAYVDRALPRVTPWGWEQPYVKLLRDTRGPVPTNAPVDQFAERSTKSPNAPSTRRQQNSGTGTNVQEIGVDEPDLVKTDGELLVRLRDDQLVVYDVTGEQTERLASLDLDGIEDGEILLAGDTVVALGSDDDAPSARRVVPGGGTGPAGTRVVTVSIADPGAPEVVDEVTYDARLLSARQHGDAVRLVLSSGLPDLDFVHPGRRRTQKGAERHNREVVEQSTIEDWLPTITAGEGDPEPLLDCTDVGVPSDELAVDTVSVVGFDASSPGEVDAIGLAGAADIAYASTDHLYLAASPGFPTDWAVVDCWRCGAGGGVSVTGGETYLFDFELDGTRATHVASGEVEGAVGDRWAMDEADGVLRVAVTPTSATGDFTSVVTLERDGQDLVEVGRLDGLGRNEDLKSVRWFDGLAILVTFRRVDPLYAVDLTDVTRPRLIAKLKIPGFSSYLHPLGPNRLVGVGEGPTLRGGWGARVGLFDVSDLSDLRQMDVQHYDPGTSPLAARDPRSFTFIHDHRTILTVVEEHRRSRVGHLSVLRIVDGELRNRMVQVEYGEDVDQVRAVPLPDGRVVLVTGEDVEFFELRDPS